MNKHRLSTRGKYGVDYHPWNARAPFEVWVRDGDDTASAWLAPHEAVDASGRALLRQAGAEWLIPLAERLAAGDDRVDVLAGRDPETLPVDDAVVETWRRSDEERRTEAGRRRAIAIALTHLRLRAWDAPARLELVDRDSGKRIGLSAEAKQAPKLHLPHGELPLSWHPEAAANVVLRIFREVLRVPVEGELYCLNAP